MEYKGAKGNINEILILGAAAIGLIILLPKILKILIKSTAEEGFDLLKDVAKPITVPAEEYIEYVKDERAEWLARVEKGQIEAEVPRITLPIIGEKEVYSIPSGGSSAFGSGTKDDDFIDVGYGMLVPAHAYFYNIKLW